MIETDEARKYRLAHLRKRGIYAIVHRDTARFYVGSSIKIGCRWRSHIREALRGSFCCIHRAIREFGLEAFDFVVLELCAKEQLLDREKFWIEEKNAASVNGFNTHEDPRVRRELYVTSKATRERIGKAHRGRKWPAETRARMSRAKTGLVRTAAHRASLSAVNKGKVLSAAHREKLSLAKRGRKRGPMPDAHRAALTAARWTPEAKEVARLRMKGRRHTPEARARLSAAHKGKIISEETRRKLSIALQGKKLSGETRAKLSASHKGKQFSTEHRAALSVAAHRRYTGNQLTLAL